MSLTGQPIQIPRVIPQEELELMIAQLRAIRSEAKGLARSGNPALRSEGKKAIAHCDEQLAWLRAELAKLED